MIYRATSSRFPSLPAVWSARWWRGAIARTPGTSALTLLAGTLLITLLLQIAAAQLLRGAAAERATAAIDAGEHSVALQLHRWQVALDLLADMPEASALWLSPAIRSAADQLARDSGGVVEVLSDAPQAPPVLATGTADLVLSGEAADALADITRRSARTMRVTASPALTSLSDGRQWVVLVRTGAGPANGLRYFRLLMPAETLARLKDMVAEPPGTRLELVDQTGRSLTSRQPAPLSAEPSAIRQLAGLFGYGGPLQQSEGLPAQPEWTLVATTNPPSGVLRALLNPLLPVALTLIAATLVLSLPQTRRPPGAGTAAAPAAAPADSLRLREARHELRSLTFSALLQAEALTANGARPARDREALAAIAVALQAMLSLEDQLTGAAPQIASFDPAALLRRVMALIGPMAESAKVTLEEDIRWTSGEVSGPRDALVQMAMNLLMNGLKYAPGAPLRLELRDEIRPDGQVLMILRVTDHGPGVERRLRRRLFLSGFRAAAKALSAPEGEGLGLSIVQRLVVAAGGNVRVSSRVGHGSTFIIELPVTRAAPAQAAVRLEGLRVLVVDDNATVRQWLAERLRQAGAMAVTTDTPKSALSLTRVQRFDAAILDITLRETSGVDLARAMRAGPFPPVMLAYSAHVDDRLRRSWLAAGFSAVFQKGTEPTPLLRLLRDLPRNQPPADTPPVTLSA
jgi:signal transduction histidine kinase